MERENLKINPVKITGKAILEIKNIIENKNIPQNYKLRIGIKGGVGCSGVNYIIGFDESTEFDNEFEMEGICMIIDKRHTMFLLGVTLDFYDGADARGFKFIPR